MTHSCMYTNRETQRERGWETEEEGKKAARDRNFIVSYEADIIFIKPQTLSNKKGKYKCISFMNMDS